MEAEVDVLLRGVGLPYAGRLLEYQPVARRVAGGFHPVG